MASPSPSSLSWLPDGRATIEKVLVAKRKEGARETNVQGLRLIRGVKREEGEEGEGEGGEAEGKGKGAFAVPSFFSSSLVFLTFERELIHVSELLASGRATSHANDADEEDNDNDEEQEEDDPSLYPVVGKPIERQVLELLMNADSRGMTGAVRCYRFLAALSRYGCANDSPHSFLSRFRPFLVLSFLSLHRLSLVSHHIHILRSSPSPSPTSPPASSTSSSPVSPASLPRPTSSTTPSTP